MNESTLKINILYCKAEYIGYQTTITGISVLYKKTFARLKKCKEYMELNRPLYRILTIWS